MGELRRFNALGGMTRTGAAGLVGFGLLVVVVVLLPMGLLFLPVLEVVVVGEMRMDVVVVSATAGTFKADFGVAAMGVLCPDDAEALPLAPVA